MENVNSITMLLIIVVLGISGVALIIGLIVVIFGGEDVNERILQYIETPIDEKTKTKTKESTKFNRFRYQLNLTLGIFNSGKIQLKLSSANWKITVTEYQLMRILGTVFAFLIGTLMSSSNFGGAALSIIVFSLPGYLLTRAVAKRQKNFQDQLIDTLTLTRGAVSTGSSFLQALDVVINEMADPTSEEFRRVRRETELGISLNQALTNLASRMESDDLYLVVNAININLQIGGNLSLILETVIDTIRNRIYLAIEIRSLTSYAHYVSYLLTLLPFITALVLALLNPIYFENLLKPGITRFVMIYALISIVLGNIALRRVSKLDI